MYKAGKSVGLLGCLVPLGGLFSIATCAFHNFFDASGNQSASECRSAMQDRILNKVSFLPANSALTAKQVVVEHWLSGNREQTEPIARLLVAQGKSARIEPREVGTTLVIQDRPQTFRQRAKARINAICTLAAGHRLKYDSWWLSGDRFSDYVSQ